MLEKNIKRLNPNKFLIYSNYSIKKSLEVIEKGEEQIAFLVNKNKVLESTISDGDIRRAILNGASINTKISKIKKRNPVSVKDSATIKEIINKLDSSVRILPEIDAKGKIISAIKLSDLSGEYNIKSRQVVIYGLGYVGLTLGLVMAEAGFRVLGFDKNKNLIDKIKNKKITFFENGLQNYLNNYIDNKLSVTSSLKNISGDIHIISVGTPVNKKTKKIEFISLKDVAQKISKILKKNDVVILRSTVEIGTTRKVVLPILEKSGLISGKDFFLSFCPERTIEGKALEELKILPQIIGGFCKVSTELSSRIFNEYTPTIINIDSLEGAEMCKLMDNTFRDVIFSYSNQISALAEKLGLNLPELIDKINLNYGRNIVPKPSPGVGGPCLSKDPYILNSSFIKYKIPYSLTKSARYINESSVKNIFKRIKIFYKKQKKDLKNAKIFLSGVAFKGSPETSDIRDSSTLLFLEQLRKYGCKKISIHDFLANKKELKSLGYRFVEYKDGFNKADVVILFNNHKNYKNYDINKLVKKSNKPLLLYDCWQMYKALDVSKIPGVNYFSVGF